MDTKDKRHLEREPQERVKEAGNLTLTCAMAGTVLGVATDSVMWAWIGAAIGAAIGLATSLYEIFKTSEDAGNR